MGVTIINGALSRDHVHKFVDIPHMSRSATLYAQPRAVVTQIQQEFEDIRKRYWGQRFRQ